MNLLLILVFLVSDVSVYAQSTLTLPVPGERVSLSSVFTPPMLKGIKVYPNDPFRFDFILDNGDSQNRARHGVPVRKDNLLPIRGHSAPLQDNIRGSVSPRTLPSELALDTKATQGINRMPHHHDASRLIKYFLAALTVPEKDLWVNLSPYEKDRIVPEAFGQTEMGRDLLAQDYILKQITASLMYPEGDVGKKFWAKVYATMQEKYGTTDIPVDTFNKVWIVPEKSTVFENKDAAYVVESRLKVMLETDYVAMHGVVGAGLVPALDKGRPQGSPLHDELAKNILREIIIPILEKEVNEGANFAQLRQVYNSLILATWYKRKIMNALHNNPLQYFIDKNMITGIGYPLPTRGHSAPLQDHQRGSVSPSTLPTELPLDMKATQVSTAIQTNLAPDQIWSQYVAAFKTGVFNYIKDDVRARHGVPLRNDGDYSAPRQYFSGGMSLSVPLGFVGQERLPDVSDRAMFVQVNLDPIDNSRGPLQPDFDRFKQWFGRFSLEILENKVIALDILRVILTRIRIPKDSEAYKNDIKTVQALIAGHYLTAKEIRSEDVLGIVLSATSFDSYTDVRKHKEELLHALMSGYFVTRQEIDERLVADHFLKDAEMRADKIVSKLQEEGGSDVVNELMKGLGPDASVFGRKMNAQKLASFLQDSSLNKDAVIKEIQRLGAPDFLVRRLTPDADWDERKAAVDELSILAEAGLVSKTEVARRIKEDGLDRSLWQSMTVDVSAIQARISVHIISVLLKGGMVFLDGVNEGEMTKVLLDGMFGSLNADVRNSYVDIFDTLVRQGRVNKNEVVLVIRDGNLLKNLLQGIAADSSVSRRKASVHVLRVLADQGLVTSEDIKKIGVELDVLFRGDVESKRNLQVLNALLICGLISREDVKNRGIVDSILNAMGSKLFELQKKDVIDLLNALMVGNFLDMQEVKEKHIVAILLHELNSNPRIDVQQICVVSIRSLIIKGLLIQEDVWGDENEGLFYDGTYSCLKILALFKNNPLTAYKILRWDLKERMELIGIVDTFIDGLTGTVIGVNAREKSILSEELINNYLEFLDVPQAFFDHFYEGLRIIVNDDHVKLAIRVYEVAAVNIARGFMKSVGINKDRVTILYGDEITSREEASRYFDGYDIQAYEGFHKAGVIRVDPNFESKSVGISSLDGISWVFLPHSPFKYNLPPSLTTDEILKKKELLGIDSKRKVIVVGCPNEKELNELIDVYNSLYGKLPEMQRPLLIIAPREKWSDVQLTAWDVFPKEYVAVRNDTGMSWPDLERRYVFVLNTAGELREMYAIGDVSILGNDFNYFEPASQGSPGLFFSGDGGFNRGIRDVLVEAGATSEFSKENLARIVDNQLERDRMAQNALNVVERHRQESLFKAREFVLRLIGHMPQLRMRFTRLQESKVQARGDIDSAQLKGGIDLNPSQFDLKTNLDVSSLGLHVDPAMIARLQHASGMTPVIVTISPLESLQKFLGIAP
ncbi:MAG: hypothetical protein V2A70_01425 [Candidatus Omnitrophota bacterium]